MLSKNSKINKILIVSLSNIGDVILTCPTIDILKNDFPQAKISVVVGPKAVSLFDHNPYLEKVHIFDKHEPWTKTAAWVSDLRRERFDLAVDLRNTVMPFFVAAKHRTPFWDIVDKNIPMKEKHLRRLKKIYPWTQNPSKRYAINVSSDDKKQVDDLLKGFSSDGFVVVAPGAANHLKRWTGDGFKDVAENLFRTHQLKTVFVGDTNDQNIIETIVKSIKTPDLNLCGRITLTQLAALMDRSTLVISNDSAPMHMASYFDKPVLAIFGPSSFKKYGPWGKVGCYVRSPDVCPACLDPKFSQPHTCMTNIKVDDVLKKIVIDKDQRVSFK